MDIAKDIARLLGTVLVLFRKDDAVLECEVLSSARASVELLEYDHWNHDIDVYRVNLEVPLDVFACCEPRLRQVEASICERLRSLTRKYPDDAIDSVLITPLLADPIEVVDRPDCGVAAHDLAAALEAQKTLMISVSTGGPRIQSVNGQYMERQKLIEAGLAERGLDNPNPYDDLWAWYGKWSSGDLPSYASRRTYIGGLFNPLVKHLESIAKPGSKRIFPVETGWTRVDRSLGEIRTRLGQASTEEQFQAVGLLCRETIVSLAQEVFDPIAHASDDGCAVSDTDAKRMLEGFLSHELAGERNKIARRHAKAALDLANELTHRRTADFRDAAMCAEATAAVVNIVAIASGQRDPG